jgi:hypothetical protein
MMSEQPKPNRGGRPKLTPPADAVATRALIAQEVIRHKPREMMLRGLFRLLKIYEREHATPLELRRVEALEQANKDKAAELEIKKQDAALRHAEYRRRFAGMPHGQRQLLKTIERLEAENAELRRELAGSEV